MTQPSQSSDPRQPFRVQMEFVCAAVDLDHANDLLDAMIDFGERVGLICEGGFVGRMPDDDVIAGSPLDDHLKGTCERCKEAS